jgi:hypothetical protein
MLKYSGYLIRFNESDTMGNVIDKDAISIKDLDRMKSDGIIIDYRIDNKGVICDFMQSK